MYDILEFHVSNRTVDLIGDPVEATDAEAAKTRKLSSQEAVKNYSGVAQIKYVV